MREDPGADLFSDEDLLPPFDAAFRLAVLRRLARARARARLAAAFVRFAGVVAAGLFLLAAAFTLWGEAVVFDLVFTLGALGAALWVVRAGRIAARPV